MKKQIPDNLLYFFKGLENGFRFKIFTLLSQHDSLSLSRILNLSHSKSGYLLKHIEQLDRYGTIDNFIEKKAGTREYSFYKMSKFASHIYTNIDEALNDFDMDSKGDKNGIYPNIFKALGNRLRFFLLLLLKKRGELDFTELLKYSERKKSSLAFHLSKLEEIHLIQNVLHRDKETGRYSFYEITNIGANLIDTVLKAFETFYKSDIEKDSNLKLPENLISLHL